MIRCDDELRGGIGLRGISSIFEADICLQNKIKLDMERNIQGRVSVTLVYSYSL